MKGPNCLIWAQLELTANIMGADYLAGMKMEMTGKHGKDKRLQSMVCRGSNP